MANTSDSHSKFFFAFTRAKQGGQVQEMVIPALATTTSVTTSCDPVIACKTFCSRILDDLLSIESGLFGKLRFHLSEVQKTLNSVGYASFISFDAVLRSIFANWKHEHQMKPTRDKTMKTPLVDKDGGSAASFGICERVWAKMPGSPPWPAKVSFIFHVLLLCFV